MEATKYLSKLVEELKHPSSTADGAPCLETQFGIKEHFPILLGIDASTTRAFLMNSENKYVNFGYNMLFGCDILASAYKSILLELHQPPYRKVLLAHDVALDELKGDMRVHALEQRKYRCSIMLSSLTMTWTDQSLASVGREVTSLIYQLDKKKIPFCLPQTTGRQMNDLSKIVYWPTK
jgi:hypothetical protein